MSVKICIDAGHYGKYNQSPCNKNYYESVTVWQLHLFLKAELENRGIEVITTREKMENDLSLEARGKKSTGCDLFISLHTNASSNTTANYSLACCMIDDMISTLDDISVKLGKKLADKVTEIMTGQKNKGSIYQRKSSNGADYYGVLRSAKKVGTPGILLEHGFHTNSDNVGFLMDIGNLQRLAIAEADIIADFFGVTKKSEYDINNDGDITSADALEILNKVVGK